MIRLLLILCGLVLLAGVSAAQDGQPPRTVTFDEVNAIARNMYCPECENIPLDKCGTVVCVQWKNEIAAQLADGRTGQEIVDDFVARFGDRVVGVPADPTLRAVSLAAPWVIALAMLVLGVGVFARLRGRESDSLPVSAAPTPTTPEDSDPLRAQLERDLKR